MQFQERLQESIVDVAEGRRPAGSLRGYCADPFEILREAASYLMADLEIGKAERIESIIKIVLLDILSKPVSGETGRALAAFQKNLGFLFKYKSYTIKCSTPVGFSVFFHNQAEGFSFQRHVTHKTEVFHILDVKKGGYVFVCEFEDWERIYDKKSFAAWLSGESNESFEKYKYEPNPGDVIVIDKLGTVHSVVGCVLEEYATASTDMVDRLHDQNTGKGIPTDFTRQFALQQLKALSIPDQESNVSFGHGHFRGVPIEPLRIRGGYKTVLLESFLAGTLYRIEPGSQTEFLRDTARVSVIFFTAGVGYLLLGDASEILSSTPPAIRMSAGETALVAPGLWYGFSNDGSIPLTVSEQRIDPVVALHQAENV